MKNFSSVNTGAARFQDLSLNPQKLAGQCAKLKCCLNYEVDCYVEASRKLPSREIVLYTQDADYYYFKADILSGMITYSTDRRAAVNLVTIPAARAFEVLHQNRRGEKPLSLDNDMNAAPSKPIDLVEQEDLTRFDNRRKKRRKKPSNNRPQQNRDNRPQ